MKGSTFYAFCLVLLVTALALGAHPAWANQERESPAGQGTSEKEASEKDKGKAAPEKEAKKEGKKTVVFPIYKPPMRGAPAGRVGGGTRGMDSEVPSVSVLAPDHLGFTIKEQPSFYWYLSSLTDYPIEFTLIENRAIKPAVEKRIPCPAKPGIQEFSLADLGDVRLKKGYKYKWYVAVILDENHRSKDIIAGAEVELKSPSEAFREKLDTADEGMLPYLFAEAGLWYDALEATSDLIEKNPGNPEIKGMRASLLEQVGLKGVAADIME